MKPTIEPEYITTKQLCERWGVCRATISIWMKKGSACARMKLPFHKLKAKVLFSITEVERFRAACAGSNNKRDHEARRQYKATGLWRPVSSNPTEKL